MFHFQGRCQTAVVLLLLLYCLVHPSAWDPVGLPGLSLFFISLLLLNKTQPTEKCFCVPCEYLNLLLSSLQIQDDSPSDLWVDYPFHSSQNMSITQEPEMFPAVYLSTKHHCTKQVNRRPAAPDRENKQTAVVSQTALRHPPVSVHFQGMFTASPLLVIWDENRKYPNNNICTQ